MTRRPEQAGATGPVVAAPPRPARELAISVIQLPWREPGSGQREHATALAAAAIRGGSQVVVLPELAVPGYTTDRDVLGRFAEPLDGPTVEAWQQAVTGTGGYIAGGFCERAGNRLYNTAVLVGADGIVLHYRKTHLFAAERTALAPGDLGFPVAETKAGVLGLCVCYDLRFIEVARLLALQGAELVCVPTAWIGGYDPPPAAGRHWPEQVTGLLVQANLNQVFIAAASVSGGPFLGGSVLADPYGTPLAGPLRRDEGATMTTSIDLQVAAAAQHRSELIHPREDRRSDLYTIEYRGRSY